MANRRTRRHRHGKGRRHRTRHTRKMRGGRNIGANNCDPNYSIYNTNFLKLFPYKA